ncbi:MAG: ATP-binding protein [Bacteroidota bacterium]
MNTNELNDTLRKLDSLANVNKIFNNALARSYAKKAMVLAQKSNSEAAFVQAYFIMGFTYRNYNDDSSFLYTSRSLRIAEKINMEKYRTRAMYNLALLYINASDVSTAVIYLDSSIQISQRIGDYAILSNGYNAYGSIKSDLPDPAGARIMYDSAYKIAQRHSLPAQEGIALASLSALETDPAVTVNMRKKAIELLKKVPGFEEEIALIYNNLGMRSTNPDTALCYYQQALTVANTIHSSEITIVVCNNQTYSYLEKNDWKNAEGCLVSNAIPLAQKEKNYLQLANLYDTYTDVLVAAKKTDEALKYARLAYKTKGLAERQSGAKEVRLLTTLLDVKNKELKLAMNERELRQKESKSRTIIILFSVSVLILALVIFFVLWRLQRNRLRYNDTMLKAAKKIIEAEENERTKIGRDFHDLTGQKFSGLASYLENKEFPDNETKNVALKMLEEIRQAVREMSHRMNRAWVERFTLEESISGLCTDCIKMANLNLQFIAPDIYPEMARETKIHLFRIVQELLTNAMQHARTSKITLEIAFDNTNLFLKYNDTGAGFDKDSPNRQGTGIENIMERVTLLGGFAELDTRPGFGTDYLIRVPLNDFKKK